MDLYSPNLLHISVEELHVSHACRMVKDQISMKGRANETVFRRGGRVVIELFKSRRNCTGLIVWLHTC